MRLSADAARLRGHRLPSDAAQSAFDGSDLTQDPAAVPAVLCYDAALSDVTSGGGPLVGLPVGGVTIAGAVDPALVGNGGAAADRAAVAVAALGDGTSTADHPVIVGGIFDVGGATAFGFSTTTRVTDDNSDQAMNADIARSTYGVSGSGLKIGILSDSFNVLGGAARDVAADDLGGYTILEEGPSTGDDEGRGMAQLVHRVAPGAQVYFYSAFYSESDFAAGIQALANAGCQTIVDDVSWPSEPFFQDGDVVQAAVHSVVSRGVSYFTAASNEGQNFYESSFSPIDVTLPGVGAVTAHNFGGSVYKPLWVAPGASIQIDLQWDQPFATIGSGHSAQNSLSLFLYDNHGNLVSWANVNEVGRNPVQDLQFTNRSSTGNYYWLAIADASGTPPGLMKFIVYGDAYLYGPGQYGGAGVGSGDVTGHELNTDANTVGAIYWGDTPRFGVSPAISESFSSYGPGELLFDANGNRLATPQVLNKVTFSAPDGSVTSVFDGAQFFGTSAAAPDAAAVAALMLQARSNLTPGDITTLLSDSTVSAQASPNVPYAGTRQTGAGLIQADAAVGWAQTLTFVESPAHPTLVGTHLNDTFVSALGSYTIDGGAGTNTLDLSRSSEAQEIVLSGTAGGYSDGLFGGAPDPNDHTAFSNIQVIKGSGYNDSFWAGGAGETIYGGIGNDRLISYGAGTYFDGGSGVNTADYSIGGSVTVNLASNSGVVAGSTPDTLINVHRVVGSRSNDSLIGGAGNDTFLVGNGGNDTVVGGSGSTTVDYANSPAGVLVNLASGTASYSGFADQLTNIRNAIGSGYDDTLIGGGSGSLLSGGSGGNDSIAAGSGNDTLIASLVGSDTLRAGSGNDVMVSGGGPTTFALAGNGRDAIGGYKASDTLSLPGVSAVTLSMPVGPQVLAEEASGVVLVIYADGTRGVLGSVGAGWQGTMGASDGRGHADILWTDPATRTLWQWTANPSGGPEVVTSSGPIAAGWTMAGSGDLNGDGVSDFVAYNPSLGNVWGWEAGVTNGQIYSGVSPGWTIATLGDFSANGISDLFWWNPSSGQTWVWLMNGLTITTGNVGPGPYATAMPASAGWSVLGAGDFNHDGADDVVWENKTTGAVVAWYMSNARVGAPATTLGTVDTSWTFAGIGDLNGDGTADIAWQTPSGTIVDWLGGSPTNTLTVQAASAIAGGLGTIGNLTATTVVSYGGGSSVTLAGVAPGAVPLGNVTVTQSYANATGPVVANLATGAVSIGGAPQAPIRAQNLIGSRYNDVLAGGAGNNTLTGGGGYDTYQFGRGGGQEVVVNGIPSNPGPSGELDVGATIVTDQLWMQRSGNDLQVDLMGTGDHLTVAGWYANGYSQLDHLLAADGSRLDGQLNNLVTAMATFTASHPGFDPTASANSHAPNDPSLQAAIAAAWRH